MRPVRLGTGPLECAVSIYVVLVLVFGFLAATATAVGAAYASRLHYRFLQHTYDKGGLGHLTVAADALRDSDEVQRETLMVVVNDLHGPGCGEEHGTQPPSVDPLRDAHREFDAPRTLDDEIETRCVLTPAEPRYEG
jgi:hypothetical protein